jgi:hypothetical protein
VCELQARWDGQSRQFDRMRTPADLPAELRDRSFNVRDATAVGVSPERLRRLDLHRPFRGVRTLEHPDTLVAVARAYAPRLTDRGFISHTSAAAVWGIPLPLSIDPRVHVSHPHGYRAVRTTGVIGHHLVMRPEELTEIDGIPITTPERTWCDLAGWMGLEALVAAGDRVLWHRAPLASAESLADMVEHHPGRRGRTIRQWALSMLSDRADSPPESILRTRIVLSGLPKPTVNVALRGPNGEWIGQPDLAFEEFREVLEYEGDGHRTDRAQWLKDLKRVPRFEDFDWHVTRAGSDDLSAGSRRILELLAKRLRRNGWVGELRV